VNVFHAGPSAEEGRDDKEYLKLRKGGEEMIFITLARWRKKPTREMVAQSSKLFEQMVEEGTKIVNVYWTLGRYDAIVITEGKDEKTSMKSIMRWSDILSTETLVAVNREEALKLIE
jgi:uncharacterized protein with GYD domain